MEPRQDEQESKWIKTDQTIELNPKPMREGASKLGWAHMCPSLKERFS